MNEFGFVRLRASVTEVKPGDVRFNINNIIQAIIKASDDNVDILLFPELCITGYTCADLFLQPLLIETARDGIKQILKTLQNIEKKVPFCAIGCPVLYKGKLYNCAIVISKDRVLGIVPKTYIPNYNEFYEKRWFESGKGIENVYLNFIDNESDKGGEIPFGTNLIFDLCGVKTGIEICEDLWVPNPPSTLLSTAGAEVILNLSATNELIGKHRYLKSIISNQSAACRCAYCYSSAGWGESSTDLVFSGNAIIAVDGEVVKSEQRFNPGSLESTIDVDIEKLRNDRRRFSTFFDFVTNENIRIIKGESPECFSNGIDIAYAKELSPTPFVPDSKVRLSEHCEEILNIQAYGLLKRLDSINCKKAVIGVSGGLDSTLALLVTVEAFKKGNLPLEGIIGVTMPGKATTSRTKNNAEELLRLLGVTFREIPIGDAVDIHFRDIGQDPNMFDVTFENSQARERTQILMDLANKENGIVIGTGDLSELALGWCTYNGDQISMYNVNASVPKTLVRHLVNYFSLKSGDERISRVLADILATPISPELVPSSNDDISQKTEDLVGPYELHDFILYHFLRNSFSPKKIYFLAKRAFKGKYEDKVILKWMKTFFRRFFTQQFKRSCMPDGPKVGSVCLSPRGDWRMPSDASPRIWLDEIEELQKSLDIDQ